jgi:hypothetical protein
MRYAWIVILASLALAQQTPPASDKTNSSSPSNKQSDAKADQSPPLFQKKLGYKSSQGTKESASMSFNGIDPSGRVDAKMMATVPTRAAVDKAANMGANRPSDADLQSFLKEGGLNSK